LHGTRCAKKAARIRSSLPQPPRRRGVGAHSAGKTSRLARHGVEWPPANSPLRLSDCNYLSLLGRIEVAQVRRLLALAHRHQIAVGAHHVVLISNRDMRVAFGAIVFHPTHLVLTTEALGRRPGARDRTIH